jgi:hypothetical protein
MTLTKNPLIERHFNSIRGHTWAENSALRAVITMLGIGIEMLRRS